MKKILLKLAGIAALTLLLVLLWDISQRREQQAAPNPIPTPTPQPLPGSATLEIFSGKAMLILPGTDESTEAINGEQITEGTKIMTGPGSRAQLIFPNNSVTRLDNDTEITLRKLTSSPFRVEIVLTKRRIWSRVVRLLGNEHFSTDTPTVIATVRGTSYGIGILPDGRNRIITTHGHIESRCVNGSQSAEIPADKKVLFDCSSGGSLPVLELDEGIVDRDEWFEFNKQKDAELDELFGAETYGDTPVTDTPETVPSG